MGTNLTDKFMNEVKIFGGFPLRRCDIYACIMEDNDNQRMADFWAFSGEGIECDEPLTLEEYREITKCEEISYELRVKLSRIGFAPPMEEELEEQC